MGKKHFAIFENETAYEEEKSSVLEAPYVAMMANTGDLVYQNDPQHVIIMTSDSNPLVMAVCYDNNIAASPDKMTLAEALAVTSLTGIFAGTNIETFDEFKYFTNVRTIDGGWNGTGAFQNCQSLRSITLPNGLKTMNGGFYKCTALTELVIPDSVTTISQFPFANSGLQKVHIGKGVVNFDLGNQASVGDVRVFTELTLDPENTSYFMQDGVLYNSAATRIVCSERGHAVIEIAEGITDPIPVDFTAAEELTWPTTITTFTNYFYGERTPNLTKFTVKAATPPSINQYVFKDHRGVLYVPSASVSAYQADTYWGQWSSIQPIEES